MFIIKKTIVSESFLRLREQKIHTLFGGYLCLQREAAIMGRLDNLKPDFRSFYQEFFVVKGHPLGSPYIKPFSEQKASSKNLWLNGNVAGSYAPSSLRPGQPFRKVVNIENGLYSLPTDHAQRAFVSLLYKRRIDVIDLVSFLYRDYGFTSGNNDLHMIINIFAYEFGYTESEKGTPSSDFDVLFDHKFRTPTESLFEVLS